ncbi:hypothetical protein FA95DRAFT_1137103 [Auriscalpium vulgare]|uniref:Uncharacterized protein n=1 Tax=Auriscalpium vulgare TaxID=40419 RepID=A0ACB8R4L1_9AGAM|nr:hypothetical protein FA95DRAFT_1137103 [Auriscalpium vulgare]
MQPPDGDCAHDSKPLDEAPYDTARPPRIVAAIFATRHLCILPRYHRTAGCVAMWRSPYNSHHAGHGSWRGRAAPRYVRCQSSISLAYLPHLFQHIQTCGCRPWTRHPAHAYSSARRQDDHGSARRADRGQSRACNVVPPHQKHAGRPRTLNLSVMAVRHFNGRRRVVLAERQLVILPGRGPKFPARQAQYVRQSGSPRRRPIFWQQRRRCFGARGMS